MTQSVSPEPGNWWPVKLEITFNDVAPNLTEGQFGYLRLDAKSRLIVTQEKRNTYSAAISSLAVAASATDFFSITGSRTKTIIVKRIRFSGASTASTQNVIQLVKRSTANSGGTSTACTNVPHDSVNPPASATVLAYTANPTTGTLVGLVRTINYTTLAANSNVPTDVFEFTFGTEEDQGIILRGVNEVLAFNLGGVTLTGGAFCTSVEWREVIG